LFLRISFDLNLVLCTRDTMITLLLSREVLRNLRESKNFLSLSRKLKSTNFNWRKI